MLVSLAFRSNFSLKHICMSVLLFQLLCCVAAPSPSRLPASAMSTFVRWNQNATWLNWRAMGVPNDSPLLKVE